MTDPQIGKTTMVRLTKERANGTRYNLYLTGQDVEGWNTFVEKIMDFADTQKIELPCLPWKILEVVKND